MVLSAANGICAAVTDRTRINALVLFASLLSWAIHMRPATFHALDSLADFVALTLIVIPADILAEVSMTKRVALAVGVDVTDRLTEPGLALEVVGALLVGDALDRLAGAAHHGRGVGRESARADAEWALFDRLADGVGAADGALARVDALVALAG